MKRFFFYIFLAAVVIGLIPIFTVLAATLIAGIAGCDVNEGSANTCMVLGADIGSTLYTMFVMGWLGLISLPIAALGALGLLILGLISLIQKLRG
jgi:hypothetical protein